MAIIGERLTWTIFSYCRGFGRAGGGGECTHWFNSHRNRRVAASDAPLSLSLALWILCTDAAPHSHHPRLSRTENLHKLVTQPLPTFTTHLTICSYIGTISSCSWPSCQLLLFRNFRVLCLFSSKNYRCSSSLILLSNVILGSYSYLVLELREMQFSCIGGS